MLRKYFHIRKLHALQGVDCKFIGANERPTKYITHLKI